MTIAEMKERITQLQSIYPFQDEDTKITLARDMHTNQESGVTLYTFDTDNDVEVTMTAYKRQK